MGKLSAVGTVSTNPSLTDYAVGIQNPSGTAADVRTPWSDVPVQTNNFYNPYKFSVYLNTDTAIVNTTIKVPFDAKDFDTSNNFDIVTNHRFTAPITGFYQLSTQIQVGSSGMGTSEYGAILLYKNGSSYLFSQAQNGSGNSDLIARPQINKLVQLNANDYIEIYFTFLGSRDITNGIGATFFSGFLVSKT